MHYICPPLLSTWEDTRQLVLLPPPFFMCFLFPFPPNHQQTNNFPLSPSTHARFGMQCPLHCTHQPPQSSLSPWLTPPPHPHTQTHPHAPHTLNPHPPHFSLPAQRYIYYLTPTAYCPLFLSLFLFPPHPSRHTSPHTHPPPLSTQSIHLPHPLVPTPRPKHPPPHPAYHPAVHFTNICCFCPSPFFLPSMASQEKRTKKNNFLPFPIHAFPRTHCFLYNTIFPFYLPPNNYLVLRVYLELWASFICGKRLLIYGFIYIYIYNMNSIAESLFEYRKRKYWVGINKAWEEEETRVNMMGYAWRMQTLCSLHVIRFASPSIWWEVVTIKGE